MKWLLVVGLIFSASTANACEHGTIEEYIAKAQSAGLIPMQIAGETEINNAVEYVNAVSNQHLEADAATVIIGPHGALLLLSLSGCVVGGAVLDAGRAA